MGVNRSNNITYNSYDPFHNNGIIPSATEYTRQQWDGLNLDLDDSSTPQWDQQEVSDNLYINEREQYAEQMADYGQQMFDLFDQYKPQYEYIAENAGVSGAELGQRLADSGAQYNANYDAMTADAERDLQRMGVNPNSGRYAAMTTGNALSKAAGYSMNQNQVRSQASQEDMNERMQAAQLGLQVGGQGVNSVNAAGNLYGQMGSQIQSSKQFYDQMQESSRQFNTSAKIQAENSQFNQAQQRYQNGLQANYRIDPFTGGAKDMHYTYGF